MLNVLNIHLMSETSLKVTSGVLVCLVLFKGPPKVPTSIAGRDFGLSRGSDCNCSHLKWWNLKNWWVIIELGLLDHQRLVVQKLDWCFRMHELLNRISINSYIQHGKTWYSHNFVCIVFHQLSTTALFVPYSYSYMGST